MKRVARAVAVVLFVVVIALTPLSAVLGAGHFETWLPYAGIDSKDNVQVILIDHTGLVRTLRPDSGEMEDGVTNLGGQRSLVASWLGGCSDEEIDLWLDRTATGYSLQGRTVSSGCPFMIGIGRSVEIDLWAPIDANTVIFSAPE